MIRPNLDTATCPATSCPRDYCGAECKCPPCLCPLCTDRRRRARARHDRRGILERISEQTSHRGGRLDPADVLRLFDPPSTN